MLAIVSVYYSIHNNVDHGLSPIAKPNLVIVPTFVSTLKMFVFFAFTKTLVSIYWWVSKHLICATWVNHLHVWETAAICFLSVFILGHVNFDSGHQQDITILKI